MSWDPQVLARVRHLHLRARIITDSILTGEHRSRRVGQAVEFADYQDYHPGADLRHLDWKVLARSDRLVVRRFETETQLPCTVVLDLSADIGTGLSGKGGYPELDTSKAGYAITLAATLLMFMHRHGEPIGLEIVAGDGVQHTSLPPRGGRQHLQQCMLSLASARPAGRAGLSRALAKVGDRTRRRSWVGVITDGMEEPEQWLGALSVFARRRTDLRFFHLFDRGEMDLQFRNPALFFSPEGGADLAVDPVGAKAAFHEVVEEYLDEVRQGVTRFGGQYMAVGTDRALEETIRTAVLSAAVAT